MAGSIALESGELSVSEIDGTILVPITRTGDLSGSVSIEYGTTSDTATSGVDYTSRSGTVTMGSGESRVVVPVQIRDDQLSEPTETFVFSLINVSGATLQAPRTARINILDNESPVAEPAQPPLTSNYNVTQQIVMSNLTQPIRFEFAPHNPSLMYIAEKAGVIKVHNSSTGSFVSNFIDIRAKVNDIQDRGLMDVALHPDFPNHPYVYAFYVVDPPDTLGKTGNAGPDGGGNRFAYVVRFTADANANYTRAVPGSELILLGKSGRTLADISGGGAIDSTSNTSIVASDIANNSDPSNPIFKPDYLKVDSRSHAGGSLAFGPDGALYVSVGDGTSFNFADPRTVSVQDLDSLSGKILRVDPLTGRGLPGNPFVQSGTSLDAVRSKVFDYGLRNPFSTGFDDSGRLLITDTGWNSYEEINVGEKGANFGWPFYEGGDDGVLLRTPTYRDMSAATAFYASVANGSIHVTAPFRAFAHADSAPGYQVQAITGGDVIYSASRYPAEFSSDYFFSDYSQGEVYSVDVNDRRDVKFLYGASGFGPVHFSQGPDGYVYYADINHGNIGRLLISAKPINGTAGPDKLTGTPVGDVINGFEGNDTINGGANADTMAGGPGNDIYVVDNSGDKIIESSNQGIDAVQSSVTIDLAANVENLTLTGTAAINGTGNTLSNVLSGNTANNTLIGGSGNDTLIGGAGGDSMTGGSGNDIYHVESSGDRVVESSGQGTDTINSWISITLPGEIENVVLMGNAFLGAMGNALANSIKGNTGNNNLNGAGGNDTLWGGAGNDKLTGGPGQDAYMFNTAPNASTNIDTITDFSVVDDAIRLENAIFTALATTGTLAPENFFSGPSAHDASDRIIYDSGTGGVIYDSDGSGSGVAVKFAQLPNGLTLTNSDFLVI